MIETIHNNCDNCAHGLEHADPACFNCAGYSSGTNKVEFRNWTPVEKDIPENVYLSLDGNGMQVGISDSCNFDTSTWCFTMPSGYHVGAGEYAIMRLCDYRAMIESRNK